MNNAPAAPFLVNYQSPEWAGLEYWWPFIQLGEGRTVREIVKGSHATFNAAMDTESWDSTDYNGRGVTFDGTINDKLQVPDEDGLSLPQTDNTALLWFQASTWTASDGLIGKFTAASGNREWGLWTSGTTNGVEFFRYTAGGFTGAGILANAAFYDGTPTLLAGRTDFGIDLLIVHESARIAIPVLDAAHASGSTWKLGCSGPPLSGGAGAGAASAFSMDASISSIASAMSCSVCP